jgi:hypothetical protein
MIESIAKDVSHDGPIAWLQYFENTPNFFMAADGRLAFSNNDSAAQFIKNSLVKSVSKIELHWNNIRIDPLSGKLAGIGAEYHEDITYDTGKRLPYDGYFTALAEQTPQGWKLRNAHWSLLVTK